MNDGTVCLGPFLIGAVAFERLARVSPPDHLEGAHCIVRRLKDAARFAAWFDLVTDQIGRA